jgi:hypothetical protein
MILLVLGDILEDQNLIENLFEKQVCKYIWESRESGSGAPKNYHSRPPLDSKAPGGTALRASRHGEYSVADMYPIHP